MQQKARALLDEVKDFEMHKIVKRYSREFSADLETSYKLADELKKWLVLCSAKDNPNYQLIGPVDDMWHIFLLYTKEYADFSRVIGSYIHHVPHDPDAVEATLNNKPLADEINAIVENGYNSFLQDYKTIFKEMPADEFWPEFSNPYGMRDDPSSGGGCGNRCGCNGVHPDSGT